VDAPRDGRFVRLSPISITPADALPYHLAYPPGMREWPALAAFRDWLSDELDRSRNELRSAERPSATAKAGRAANR
jgi:LysR family glycine cleavage system transcriptional activator